MSLKVVYRPPQRIVFTRKIQLHFIVSHPSVYFVQKHHHSDAKPIKPSFVLQDYSLASCADLMQHLMGKKNYEGLFAFANPLHASSDLQSLIQRKFGVLLDLSVIQSKLANLHYESVDEFRSELTAFLTMVSRIEDIPLLAKSALKCMREVNSAFTTVHQTKDVDISRLSMALDELAQPQATEDFHVDLIELAKKLNRLNMAEKLKAEFIVRTLAADEAYFSRGVDLATLPCVVIEELSRLVES